VVTNADEAAGRRHQPAFLFLPARDMKGGGCSKMEVCDECCRGSSEDGKVAISIGRNRLERLSVMALSKGTNWVLRCTNHVIQFKHIYGYYTAISCGSRR
jgi:hypothetical protein